VKIIYDMSGKMFFPDGRTAPFTVSEVRGQTRPQHSAVVSSNYGKGVVVIFEQHVNTPGKNRDSVQKNQIYIDSQGPQKGTPKTRSYDLLSQRDINKLIKMFGKDTIQDYRKIYKKSKIRLVEDKRTFKVIVSGQIWAYRPVPKE